MKSLFTVLAAAGLVAAADPSSSSPGSTSPQIQNVSPSCSSFLTNLNTAPGIQTCVKPIVDALTSNNTASLPSLCSTISSSACSDTTTRTWLTYFRGNCSVELTSNSPDNKGVRSLNDVLYIYMPFMKAVCSKDDAGNYCLSKLSSNSSSKAASGLKNAAQTPLTSGDGTPDAQAFASSNILFLGVNPSMDAGQLCTTCTKNILTSYMTWESSLPPIGGLGNSPLLAPQLPLWSAIQQKCPPDFIHAALANAGASPAAANAASSTSPAKTLTMLLALIGAGAMAL